MQLFTNKNIKNTLAFVGFSWIAASIVAHFNQRKLVFNPATPSENSYPRGEAHRARNIFIPMPDGTRLSGVLLTPSRGVRFPAVIYFGGRSEDVLWVAKDAHRMFPNVSVLAVNYRGYGRSKGRPDEKLIIEDACFLYDWLVTRNAIKHEQIALVGRSLGTGVAIQLATKRSVSALFLLTPYDSLIAIAKRKFWFLPVSLILRHRFNSVKHILRLSIPVFILRSQTDDIVPSPHTDKLAASVPNLLTDEIIPDSSHCNFPYLETTQRRLSDLIKTHFKLI